MALFYIYTNIFIKSGLIEDNQTHISAFIFSLLQYIIWRTPKKKIWFLREKREECFNNSVR